MKKSKLIRTMNSKMKCVAVVLAVGASAAMASISVDFTVDSGYTGPTRLNAGNNLTLDFSIDGSGNVTLDASPSGGGNANVTNTVNGWDGAVGTVSDSPLYNSSFTLTARGYRRNNAGTAYPATSISLEGNETGFMGIYGQNASNIDGATLTNTNLEQIVWTMTTSTAGLEVDFTSLIHDGFGTGGGRDILVFDADTTDTWMNQANIGTNSLSGYVLGNGDTITFAAPADGNVGYGISGLTLDVIPEPATLGLVAVFGGGVLFIRRRFMM